MGTYRKIIHQESGQVLVEKAQWCNTFATKLRGYTFRRNWLPNDGLVLVENGDSRMTTSIHMLFVFFDLGVLWVNNAGNVVDKVVARPWRLSYVPQSPARYVIEAHPDIVDRVAIGDTITFSEELNVSFNATTSDENEQ